MRHAFDQVSVERVGSARMAPLPFAFNRRDVTLLALGLPPVLLAIWLCAIQYNLQRGASSIRWAIGLEPAFPRPLFLGGSAAGLVLVLGVTIIGGPANAAGVLSQPAIWVLILLPEAAWAGPMAVACVLLPMQHISLPYPARKVPARRGAFE